MDGIGCEADPAAGASLMRQAANQGNVNAQFKYADYLERGVGVAKDLALAAHFYILAMDGGHSLAKAEYERLRGSVPPA
jgi:TPR repeat protein